MDEQKETKWAILIGINKYHESIGSLKYAVNDVISFRDVLLSATYNFPEDQVLMLSDDEKAEFKPTFANIHSLLASWLSVPKPQDMVLVFFAGHGRLVNGQTVLIPNDATANSVHTLGIPLSYLQGLIQQCRAKQKLLILDACHSGSGRDFDPMSKDTENQIKAASGFYTMSSCSSEEVSYEWNDKQHGVFSYYLTEALQGACNADEQGLLTVDRVYQYVYNKVSKWALKNRCKQNPISSSVMAGSLVLYRQEPDYKALMNSFSAELDKAKARELELKLHISRLEEEQNKRKLEEKLQQKNKKKITKVSDQPVEELPVEIEFIVYPDVECDWYIDYEREFLNYGMVSVMPGKHIVQIIPESKEWGTVKKTVWVRSGKKSKNTTRLPRACSSRSMVSFLLIFVSGIALSLFGLLFPSDFIWHENADVIGLIAYAIIIIPFVLFPLSIIIEIIWSAIVISIRGLVLHDDLEDILYQFPYYVLVYGGPIIFFLGIVGFFLSSSLTLRHIIFGWLSCSSLLIGVIYCIIPHPGRYSDRNLF
jgi:hypothetical protein